MTTVSGILTIRNSFEAGYPLTESILSIYPIVDEFLINDGGSDDGTLDLLEELAEVYPKIELYQIEDEESEAWETIDDQLEQLIDEASGEWLIESQADEIWHEDDILEFSELLESTDANSIRQPRPSVNVAGEVMESQYRTVRAVRNVDNLTSWEGGDNFQIGSHEAGLGEYTTHKVPPEIECDIPIYHLNTTFPNERENHAERHAMWLATESDARMRRYEEYTSDS